MAKFNNPINLSSLPLENIESFSCKHTPGEGMNVLNTLPTPAPVRQAAPQEVPGMMFLGHNDCSCCHQQNDCRRFCGSSAPTPPATGGERPVLCDGCRSHHSIETWASRTSFAHCDHQGTPCCFQGLQSSLEFPSVSAQQFRTNFRSQE